MQKIAVATVSEDASPLPVLRASLAEPTLNLDSLFPPKPLRIPMTKIPKPPAGVAADGCIYKVRAVRRERLEQTRREVGGVLGVRRNVLRSDLCSRLLSFEY